MKVWKKPKVGAGHNQTKYRFKHFRHKKGYDKFEGKISMRFLANREIKFWW